MSLGDGIGDLRAEWGWGFAGSMGSRNGGGRNFWWDGFQWFSGDGIGESGCGIGEVWWSVARWMTELTKWETRALGEEKRVLKIAKVVEGLMLILFWPTGRKVSLTDDRVMLVLNSKVEAL